jgi:cell division protease FtsH
MVTKYGFSEKLGTVVYGDDNGEVFLGKDYGHTRNYSEEIASEIDAEVRRIIAEAHEQCEAILREHIDELHLVAKYLIENEKIDGDDFEKLIHGELDVKKDEIPSEKEKPTETDININIPEEKKDEPEISVGFSKESDDTEVSVSIDSAKKTDSEDSDNTEE